MGRRARRQRRQARGAERFADNGPHRDECEDQYQGSNGRQGDQQRTRKDQGKVHDSDRTDAVGELAGDRRADQSAETIERDREPGLRRRIAQILRDIENQERQHHRAGAVDERRRKDDPRVSRKIAESAPRVRDASQRSGIVGRP